MKEIYKGYLPRMVPLKWGSRGSRAVWYKGCKGCAGVVWCDIDLLHGIHTSKKCVLTAVGWLRGSGCPSRGWGVLNIEVEVLECPAVCDPKCVVAGIYPSSCLMKGHLPR